MHVGWLVGWQSRAVAPRSQEMDEVPKGETDRGHALDSFDCEIDAKKI